MKDKIPALVALTAFATMAMYGSNVDGATPSMLQECMKNVGFGLGGHILAQEGINQLLLHRVSEKDFLNHDLQDTFKRAFKRSIQDFEKNHSQFSQKMGFDYTKVEITAHYLAMEASNILDKMEAMEQGEIKTLLYAPSNHAAEQLWNLLKNQVKLGYVAEDKHLVEALQEMLLRLSVYYFGEELKINKPANNRAWRAFQKLLLEELQAQNKQTQSNQSEIQDTLEKIEKRLSQEDAETVRLDFFEKEMQEMLELAKKNHRLLIGLDKKMDDLLTAVQSSQMPQQKKEAKYLSYSPPSQLNPHFIGRTEEMAELEKRLKNRQSLLLINGIGGIGKTALSQHYFITQQDQYDHLIWLNYSSNLPLIFTTQINVEALGITASENIPLDDLFKNILYQLQNMEGNNLLVIDSLNDPEELQKYQQQLQLSNWKILISSRADPEGFESYKIATLGIEKATELFTTHYKKALSPQEAINLNTLLEHIGCHTLTIEILAKNLQKLHNYSIQDLLNNLEEKGLLDLDKSRKIATKHTPQKIKIEDLLPIIFDLNPLSDYEKHLLLQFAVLPAIPILYKYLYEWLKINDESEELFDETLESLTEKGWLQFAYNDEQKATYKIHQVVQEVIKKENVPSVEKCGTLIYSLKFGQKKSNSL